MEVSILQSIYKRARIAVLIFLVAMSMFVYLGIYRPIETQLKDEVIHGYELTAGDKIQLLHANFQSAINHAEALSSRSVIRDLLNDYTNGKVTLEELREFTIARYTDGAFTYNMMISATRYSFDRQLIVNVGEEVENSRFIDFTSEETIAKLFFEEEALFAQSPILADDRIIGYDVLIADLSEVLTDIIEDMYSMSYMPGNVESDVVIENGKIISSHYCDVVDGTFFLSADEKPIFSAVNELTNQISTIYFVVLFVIYLIIQFLVVKYISKFVENEQLLKEEAQEREREKNLLIEEMNKGFVLLKKNNKESAITTHYEVEDANSIFLSMVGMRLDQIKGEIIADVLRVESEKKNSFIRRIIDDEKSKQFEYYLTQYSSWWIFSVYKPSNDTLAIICEDITAKKRVEEKIIESEERVRLTYEVTGEGLWDWYLDGNMVYHNRRWCEILGLDEKYLEHSMEEFKTFIHPEDLDEVLIEINDAIDRKQSYFSEHRLIRSDGSVIWVEDRGAVAHIDNNKVTRMIGSIADVTDRKKAQDELFYEKEKLKSTILSVSEGIMSTEVNGDINVINPAAEELIEWQYRDAELKNIHDIFKIIDSEGQEIDILESMFTLKETENHENEPVTLVTMTGKRVLITYSVSPVHLSSGEIAGFVVVFRDVTNQVKRQKRIEFLSLHDELTGLYNRRFLNSSLHELDTKENLPFTVMMLDLNSLKLANDTFGHEMGDEIIKKTADLLRNMFRSDDIVSRTGGDEFCILLPNTTEKEAKRIKERIKKVAPNYLVEPFEVSLAIGYSVKNNEFEDIEDTIRYADANMYEDKQVNEGVVRTRVIENLLNYNYKKFPYEKLHNDRVKELAGCLYKRIREGLEDDDYKEFLRAVSYHDIGKVVIPKSILGKKDKLTDDEYEVIKKHSEMSYQILRELDEDNKFIDSLLYHHERMDGKGYPEGLAGKEIPLGARIIAVVDAYEAMTSKRPYREEMSKIQVINELRGGAGTQFDKELVEIFIEILEKEN